MIYLFGQILRNIEMNIKSMYADLIKQSGFNQTDFYKVLNELKAMNSAFYNVMRFFEFRPQYTIEVDGVHQTAYEYFLYISKTNSFMLNTRLYKSKEYIGNLSDHWIDCDDIPDDVKEDIFKII